MINKINKLSLFLFVFLGIFLIYKYNQDLHLIHISFIYILFILSSTFVILPFFKIDQFDNLPLFILVNLYFLFCYVCCFLFNKYGLFFDRFEAVDYGNAINILFIGYIFFVFGYFLSNFFLRKFQRKEFKTLNCNEKEILVIGLLLLISNIIFYYIIKIQNYVPAIHQVKYPTLLFGIGLTFQYIIITKNKKFYFRFILLPTLILIPIFYELVSGAYSFPFMILFLLFVYYVFLTKKINIIPFLILSLLFVFIHAGKYDYRKLTWNKKSNQFYDEKVNFLKKSSTFFDMYLKRVPNRYEYFFLIQKDKRFDTPTDRLQRRIFHSLWSLLIVRQKTPESIPYWKGYSYKILSSKIIPRIFWKNKPSDRLGNEFGHRYNVLSTKTDKTNHDASTSWNMPVLNEFYLNFGTIGVVNGMFMLGIIYNLITKLFSIRNKLNLECTFAFFLFVPLFFLESHLSLIFGALIQSYVFSLFLSFFLIFLLRKSKLLK